MFDHLARFNSKHKTIVHFAVHNCIQWLGVMQLNLSSRLRDGYEQLKL